MIALSAAAHAVMAMPAQAVNVQLVKKVAVVIRVVLMIVMATSVRASAVMKKAVTALSVKVSVLKIVRTVIVQRVKSVVRPVTAQVARVHMIRNHLAIKNLLVPAHPAIVQRVMSVVHPEIARLVPVQLVTDLRATGLSVVSRKAHAAVLSVVNLRADLQVPVQAVAAQVVIVHPAVVLQEIARLVTVLRLLAVQALVVQDLVEISADANC